MKIVLAPDSFKGTFTSLEVINYLQEAAIRHFSQAKIIPVPIADGGEGTVEALVTATRGEYREVNVTGPMGITTKAKFGVINHKTAVIEMAQASGLILCPKEGLDPFHATTYGTGELIKAALDLGLREIVIGIGGSATNDGGIGAAQALGVRITDCNGKEVGFGGGQLPLIGNITLDGLDKRVRDSRITVICDVKNPLTGKNGATFVYGPQKGATAEDLVKLEEGMVHYSKVLERTFGSDMGAIPGTGAAGGLGVALVGLLGAELKSGIDEVLNLVGFDGLIEDADLVVTGEGKIDEQSVFGKAVMGVGSRCKNKNVRAVAITGCIGSGAQKIYEYGIDGIISTVNRDMTLKEALDNSEELLRDAADRLFRFLKTGMEIQNRQNGKQQLLP